MFNSITNVKQREKFIRLLGVLVAAATTVPEGKTAPVGYALLKKEDAEKMAAAEPTFISINPNVAPDAKGNVQVAALAAGMAALQASQVAPAADASASAGDASAETQIFTIDTNVPLPNIQRGGGGGGNRESKYPFSKLELPEGAAFGGSFFVKTTPKAFASTISAQNRKYKGQRKFTIRTVTENGVQGVRVWRIPVPAPKPETTPAK